MGTCEPSTATPSIPNRVRWIALIWLLVWVPIYWYTWGISNFVQLCDIALVLTSIGLWVSSPLLITSQAISSFAVGIAWAVDASWMFIYGRPLTGGTEYLFDPTHPLWIRLLSLYHVVMPLVLIWALFRLGYDRRGFRLQCVIVVLSFIAARFTPPEKNMDFAFTDPFFHRSLGPAPLHVAISVIFMIIVVYYPTDFILQRVFARTPASTPR